MFKINCFSLPLQVYTVWSRLGTVWWCFVEGPEMPRLSVPVL